MKNMRCLGTLALLACAATAHAAPILRASDDAGTIYLGAVEDNDWGRPVASADLDGDGFDEIIVAASESFGGLTSSVYVVRGGPDGAARGTIDLSSTAADLTIFGAAVDDNLGSSIATGDVNSDGFADLLMCASNADFGALTAAGVAYLLYGGPEFFATSQRVMSNAADWDVRIAGPVADGDMGGYNLFGGLDTHAAAIGDINADGFGDIVLGVHLADGSVSLAGRVYVVAGQNFASGTTLQLSLATDYLFRVYGRATEDMLGEYVTLGDLTGDGILDLIIPVHYASQTTFASEGAVFIFRGRTAWAGLYNLNSTNANITLLGNFSYDELGSAAVVGDFNNDGIDDLAVSASGADVGTPTTQQGDGFVYGLLGSTAYQTGTHLIDYATATPAFVIKGEFQQVLGYELAAGDFNGDGIDDVAAAQRTAGGASNGTIDVVFGRSFTAGQTFLANQTTDVRIVGAAQDRIGFSLGACDTDSDGVDEILYGTPFNNGPSFSEKSGTVYVHSLLDGDFDGDGALDLRDFAAFQRCYTLPGAPADNGACYVFDLHPDGQLDAADAQEFTDRLTGP